MLALPPVTQRVTDMHFHSNLRPRHGLAAVPAFSYRKLRRGAAGRRDRDMRLDRAYSRYAYPANSVS